MCVIGSFTTAARPPGDFVEIEIDSLNDEKGQIITLQERKNTFLRWNVKGRCPQLLASNLDYLILVTTPCEPPFRPRFIDRALAQAEHQGITPVVVCNKWDLAQSLLDEGLTQEYEEIETRLKIWLGEALIFRRCLIQKRNPFLFSFVLNAASYGIGLFV